MRRPEEETIEHTDNRPACTFLHLVFRVHQEWTAYYVDDDDFVVQQWPSSMFSLRSFPPRS